MMSRWLHYLPIKPLLILLAIAAITGLAYGLIPAFQQWSDGLMSILMDEDVSAFRQWIQGYGWWGPVLLVVLMCIQLFLVVVPSFLLIMASVLAYGAVNGALLAFISVLFAAAFAYGLGLWLGKGWVEKVSGEQATRKVTHYLDAYGFWTVIIARVSPFLSNDIISLVAGILSMSFWRFMLATAVGICPLIGLIAVLGKDYDSMTWALVAASVLGIAGLGLKVWADHRGQGDHNHSHQPQASGHHH